MTNGPILIVDHDDSVLQALLPSLRAAGLDALYHRDGSSALAHQYAIPPAVALFELWLPDMDGLALLQRFAYAYPHTAIIVMSAHGTIATAVQALKLGAVDYLEKPVTPATVLQVVQHTLHPSHAPPRRPPSLPVFAQRYSPNGTASRQRTLRRSIVIQGHGLLSGHKTGLILSPLPPHHNIVFRDITTGECMPLDVRHVVSTDVCTSLRHGRVTAHTIEHLLSALHAYRLTNLLIQLSDEIPILDGSADIFCQRIEEAGIIEQEAAAESIVVDRRYHIGSIARDTKFILIDPYDGFRVTYRGNYPPPIGIQEWSYELYNERSYRRDIAPARTFAFVADVETMHAQELIAGGRLNNVILLGENSIVNSAPLRFANEFVRHKILDIIGDMYLLGRPMRGHVQANMTGHTENVALVRHLCDTLPTSGMPRQWREGVLQ
jgi:UDP-3-O-acyl N-acetylglucosamine deacetylase